MHQTNTPRAINCLFPRKKYKLASRILVNVDTSKDLHVPMMNYDQLDPRNMFQKLYSLFYLIEINSSALSYFCFNYYSTVVCYVQIK